MRKMMGLVFGLLVFAASTRAQETPKAELFGGYSYLRLGGSGGANLHGGSVSLAGNFSRWFGAVADVGGYHTSASGASVNAVSYAIGPRFSYRSAGRWTPFAQALFGGAHVSARAGGFSGSANAFATSAGGGLDVKLSEHVALRALQVEYVLLRSQGVNVNSGRASAGIVFRFGRK